MYSHTRMLFFFMILTSISLESFSQNKVLGHETALIAQKETDYGLINTMLFDIEKSIYFQGYIVRSFMAESSQKENGINNYLILTSKFNQNRTDVNWGNPVKDFVSPFGFVYVVNKKSLNATKWDGGQFIINQQFLSTGKARILNEIYGDKTAKYSEWDDLLFIGNKNENVFFGEWSGMEAYDIRLHISLERSKCYNCPIGKQKNGPSECEYHPGNDQKPKDVSVNKVPSCETSYFLSQYKPKIILSGEDDKIEASILNGITLLATSSMVVGETQVAVKNPGGPDVVGIKPNMVECILIALDISALEEDFGTFGWIEGSTYGKAALYFNKGYLEIRVSDKNQYNVSLRDNRFVYPYILLKGTEIEFQLGSTKISIKSNDL